MNLFDPGFTTTLLRFAGEDVLLGVTTVHYIFEADGHQHISAHAMPLPNQRTAFAGELFNVQFEEVVVAIDSISDAPFEGQGVPGLL